MASGIEVGIIRNKADLFSFPRPSSSSSEERRNSAEEEKDAEGGGADVKTQRGSKRGSPASARSRPSFGHKQHKFRLSFLRLDSKSSEKAATRFESVRAWGKPQGWAARRRQQEPRSHFQPQQHEQEVKCCWCLEMHSALVGHQCPFAKDGRHFSSKRKRKCKTTLLLCR